MSKFVVYSDSQLFVSQFFYFTNVSFWDIDYPLVSQFANCRHTGKGIFIKKLEFE